MTYCLRISSSIPISAFVHPAKASFIYKRTLFPLSHSASRALSLSKHCVSPSSPLGETENLTFSGWSREAQDKDFVVVNFYRFVYIEDPEAEISKHFSFLAGLDIRGRIYLNEQGINAQYSGPYKDSLAYVEWLRQDDRLSDLLVQITPAVYGHAFPKLKLRYRSCLVQYEGGTSHLPLVDPSMRAKPLAPSEWKERLEEVNDDVNTSHSKPSHELHSVGCYEWDVGHFHGAQRPDVDCFRSTTFGLSQREMAASDPLVNVDKEKTDILMYCTGGIRCDVYSTLLRQRGFKNLYTLKGGVSHYLEIEGTAGWVGNLFVFDSRLSLPPSAYSNKAIAEPDDAQQVSKEAPFARCYICRSHVQVLRHRNCANLDCNLLFLCCADCVKGLRGCCCVECTSARRLRPVLPRHQRYQKWHVYRDLEIQGKFIVHSDVIEI